MIPPLKNNITDEIISKEYKNINKLLKSELDLKNLLISYMEKIASTVNNVDSTLDVDFIYSCLLNLKKNFDEINSNISILNSLIVFLDLFKDPKQNIDIDKYNLEYENAFSKHFDIEITVYSFIQNFMIQSTHIKFQKEDSTSSEEQSLTISDSRTVTHSESKNNLLENTLIISDTNKKVILPYKISTLQKILDKNKEKYKTLEDVIDDCYTIPLAIYKNPSLARFKEAFNLVKNKEKGSAKDALDLGLELFFNSNLNPAIITACKDLDELDIYLSCLDDNELNKFTCFNIVYECLPTKANKKQNK